MTVIRAGGCESLDLLFRMTEATPRFKYCAIIQNLI